MFLEVVKQIKNKMEEAWRLESTITSVQNAFTATVAWSTGYVEAKTSAFNQIFPEVDESL